MTLNEWIAKYEQRTGEYPYIEPGYQVVFDEEQGFFYWRKNGDVFEVGHVCCHNNRSWWREKAIEAARQAGCTLFRTYTNRDPAAYMRLQKCKLNPTLSGVKPNGVFYWCMEMQIPGGDYH